MKPLTNRIMLAISLLVLFVVSQLIILAYSLWMQQKYAYGTVLMCLAVVLFLWPDPKPKLNKAIPNPYKQN